MTITQKRLELLGERPDDIVQIETIKDKKGSIKGTKVQVRIKIK